MMGTLCAQLLIQFYTDQFETLQALLSWSVDVLVFWHYLQFNFCQFFFFRQGSPCGVIPLFRLRHLTDAGYFVCATPDTVLY